MARDTSPANTSLAREEATNPTYVSVNAFVDELGRAGLRHIVICPGSRSTPLAMAIAQHPSLRIWMHVDERSAAFFGLGMAKQLRQPVALLCTSGTAAANFLPAIVEAHLTHVPLLVLTADRPPELRDCGAPQAIDQIRLYGNHVKWFVDAALPEASNTALRALRTLAGRALALTSAIPAGPVHLNLPFREPLTPEPLADQPLPEPDRRDPIAWQGRAEGAPYVAVYEVPLAAPSAALLTALAAQLRATPHGLIIAGPLDLPALTVPLIQLAQRLGYPILADPLSQLRCGAHTLDHIITSYDAFLRMEQYVTRMQPQFVLRFGAMPTAKPLLLYLKRYADCPQIVIDGQAGWEEPTQLASQIIHADPVAFCRDLLTALDSSAQTDAHSSWLADWQYSDQLTREALHAAILDFQPLFEGRIFTELAECLPADTALFVGNSMPVRDLDTFFWSTAGPLRLFGNRGANGIDGVVSSALGVSATRSKAQPTVLVIGDLSFFHDLNGLLAARLHHLNLVIVLVQNNGGGIFSFLPQAAYPDHFEQLFGTPTELDFQPVVQMYGGNFHRAPTWQAFRGALKHGLTEGGLHVIEIVTERSSNVTMHRQLWQAVERAFDGHCGNQAGQT